MLSSAILTSFERWKQRAVDDPDLIPELVSIEGDETQIADRFYREMEFGTAGLRGVIGAGENRMNVYTVRRATQGLADYLRAKYPTSAVAISFDSRIKSTLFAREAARVLAGNGVTVHLFDALEPTPVLSYAVRALKCQSGIMITASHNPAQYNGYKCYGDDGCQMTDDAAGAVTARIAEVDIFDGVRLADFDAAVQNGRIRMIGKEIVDGFLACVEKQQVHPGICGTSPLSVIYTPLNGTGNQPVREILRRIGVADVAMVPEQELPDGNFPTAPYPNPEFEQPFECARAMAAARPAGKEADLLLATDPDCDRVGIQVRHDGAYARLTGNEVGCLLLDYILEGRAQNGTLPKDGLVVKTIVTSDLVLPIAAKFGCRVAQVLTGFKYIGEQILRLEQAGQEDNYVFGFEESYGYLAGTHARDKDAVVASMLICEMAAYYKAQGRDLFDVLDGLYAQFGVYRHAVLNKEFDGEAGMRAMQRMMDNLRAAPPTEIDGLRVLKVIDYEDTAATGLPRSNVLSFRLEGDAGVIVRPSGTEPKIKGYITATGKTAEEADALAEKLAAAFDGMLEG